MSFLSKLSLSLILFISLSSSLFAQHVGVIPQPSHVVLGKDSLVVVKDLVIHGEDQNSTLYLKQNLLKRFQLIVNSNPNKAAFIKFLPLKKEGKNSSEEYYEIEITKQDILVYTNTSVGAFNATNSLIQLFYFYQNKGKIVIPTMQIKDAPVYAWRGFMLDESRHFFGKEKVKQLLDYMALYKLNKFHWHLTDEPAWRIEIKNYPFLTLVGGVGSFLNPLTPAQYYTQDEISEIVQYAAFRHIQVIPEIDMPGHATAANRAYPQFSGGGTKEHPDFTFHPAKEGTYNYLTNILKEVSVLFPSQLLHLGGDEVAFGSEAWNADKSIQELKAKLNLSTNKDVERYFMLRMADSVYNMGAKLVVWDEMVDANLPSDKTIMYWWRHDKPEQLTKSLKNGYATVICPRIPLYFDFVQLNEHKFGRKWGGDFNPLERVYNYDLTPYKSQEIRSGQILGIQANLWTERIHNADRFDFMVFPRIAALAETAWTVEHRKDYSAFKDVLKVHLNIYKADDLYYFDPFDNAHAEPKVGATTKKYIDIPE